MENTDRYASAKATLRENVKWLSAGFAGMAGIVLAGTPFTGFGTLPIGTWRFKAALAGLVVAVVSAFIAWQLLLRMVRPDATYTRYLGVAPGNGLAKLGYTDRREYRALTKEFEAHTDELLPDGSDTVADLENLIKEAWDDYQANPTSAISKDRWEKYDANMRVVQDWAAYTRLYQRIRRGLWFVQFWGLVLLVALAVFAWCATPKEKDAGAATPALVENHFEGPAPALRATPMVHLAPVLFELNKASLTPDGLQAIGAARDYLRGAPESALLLLAHTDTTGGATINAKLAARRVEGVRRELIQHGGIAPTRIFTGEFPREDLAVLTADRTPLDRNRSVEFVAIPMPAR